MRATYRSTFALALLLLRDLACWARHIHEDCGHGRALCSCGREWQGRLLRSRNWRAEAYDLTAELWATEDFSAAPSGGARTYEL